MSADKIRLPMIFIGNLALVLLIYLGLFKLNVLSVLPNEIGYLSWDVAFYRDIKDIGYVYATSKATNMAFFPLFPYIWKMVHLSALQMGVFNFALFACSFIWLIGKEKFKAIYLLVLISIPCFIFFYLPYSESLFFLFGTLIIKGYRNDKFNLLIIGILGCCLTRAISTVFIPMIIITELLHWKNSKELIAFPYKRILVCCSAALLAILIVISIQGIQTGKWFYYMEMAKKFNRALIFPSFPFTTISPDRVLGIDGIAWVVGFIATYFCIKWSIISFGSFFLRQDYPLSTDRSVYFSALFISAVFLIDTFFTNHIEDRTNLWSINRHLLCTPFAVHFINWFFKDCRKEKPDLYSLTIILLSGLFITGVYQYQLHIYFYLIFVTAIFLSKFFDKALFLLYPLYAFNLMLAIVLYHDFLSFKWAG
jgi:hypothetical protein